jgi:transcriptional antiterminator RfaH
MTERWFLVCSLPGSERRAVKFLSGPDFCCLVYCPLVEQYCICRGRLVARVQPFLPPYMFVRDDGQGTARIRSAPGVESLVTHAGQVATVAGAIVDGLRAREDRRGLIRLDDDQATGGFCEGDEIQVEDERGFTMFTGLFRHMDGLTRAAVFLRSLGGGLVRSTVGIDRLRLA